MLSLCMMEALREVEVSDRRRGEQRDGRHQQQAGIESPAGPVELLHMVAQAADQQAGAEHEQRVGDDCAGD